MAARDIFHEAVKQALIKDGWTITHDPLFLPFGGIDLYVDLGAEKVIAGDYSMARLEAYRQAVQHVLEQYADNRPAIGDVEIQPVFDIQHDHYQLVTVGWQNQQRLYGALVHVDIKDSQIWIQYDGTERGIANDLVEHGIPKADIVLGFQAPYKRPYTGFGIANDSSSRHAA